MDAIMRAASAGLFATVAIDIWATFANRALGLPRTNWALVGRWLGHLPARRFVHRPIGAAAPVGNELLIGWAFHYLIGLLYAALYFAYAWIAADGEPTLRSAILFGLLTLLSPWFILQPALGLGVCARRAPRPHHVRLQNIIIHSIFGAALYGGWIATQPPG